MPSRSSNPTTSISTLEQSQATSTASSNKNMEAAIEQTTQQSDTPQQCTDPTQRSTGEEVEPLNTECNLPPPRSYVLESLEKHHPKLLRYYEARRTGKSEARPPKRKRGMCYDEALRMYRIEYSEVMHVFYPVDYSRGFTGRGVSREIVERADLIGPRNETVEERVIPLGGLSNGQDPRVEWKTSDGTIGFHWERPKNEEKFGPLQESRKNEDVGLMGESKDEGEAGHFEESSDGDNDLQYNQEDERAEREEGQRPREKDEQEIASTEDESNLIQMANTAIAMMSNSPADAEDTSSPCAGPIEPQISLTSSPSLASAPRASSRKRSRDAEEDAKDEESAQQKRRRMDDVLKIVKKDAKAANVPQGILAAKRLYIKHTKKRARSLDTDSPKARSCNDAAEPRTKRLRLYQRPRQTPEAEEYVTANHSGNAVNGESTFVDHDSSSSEFQQTGDSDKISADAQACREIIMEGDLCVDDETESSVAQESLDNEAEDSEDVSSDHEIVTTHTGWNTAHGINSKGANIQVAGKDVWNEIGEGAYLFLPNTEGSLNRRWTKAEKENLRAYIQDYRIEDWTTLSKSTNRAERDLQKTYLNIIVERNKRAGRRQFAGIPEEYPRLAIPPPPQESEEPAAPPHSPAPSSVEPEESATPPAIAELPNLRPRKCTGQIAKDNLGDLTYDVKARSFPKVTRDGCLVDSKGDTLPEAMIHTSSVAKRSQPKLKLKLKLKASAGFSSPEGSGDDTSPETLPEAMSHTPSVTKHSQPKLKLKLKLKLKESVGLSSAEGSENDTSCKTEKIGDDSEIEEGEIIEEDSSIR